MSDDIEHREFWKPMEENKINTTKLIFNAVMFLLGISILLILIDNKCSGGEEYKPKIDTVVILAPKPEVHNYNFTNPTVYKEKTIEYNTATHEILTRRDSDLIVYDYLKERWYRDSIFNDTSKVVYDALVSKNHLDSIHIRHSYRPKIYSITKTETKYRNSLFVGFAGGWFQQTPTAGFYAGFETKQFGFGGMYDPFKNPQGGYLFISKRINFRK
jgi:hypothetical protein